MTDQGAEQSPATADSGNGPSVPEADHQPALTVHEQVGHYIEMWKQAVQVQQHFNDIEWRIRGLALTVATFALGAAGVAAKDGTRVGWFSLGALVILIGLLLWYAFYFVDHVWYHPLLKAAVSQGTRIENEIKKVLPQAGMTASITAGSVQPTGRLVGFLSRRKTMHSDDKLVWFYKIGAAALIIAAAALQLGILLGSNAAPGKPTPAPATSAPATSAPATPASPTPAPASTASR